MQVIQGEPLLSLKWNQPALEFVVKKVKFTKNELEGKETKKYLMEKLFRPFFIVWMCVLYFMPGMAPYHCKLHSSIYPQKKKSAPSWSPEV